MGKSKWYYSDDGKRAGPLSSTELRQMAAAGTLRPDHHVWKEGLPKWVPASRVKGLFRPASPVAPPEETSIPEDAFLEAVDFREDGSRPEAISVETPGGREEKDCPYCGETILAVAKKCKHCGEFMDGPKQKAGKAVFRATRDFIGLLCSYHIMDSNKRVLEKLKPGESFETAVQQDTRMFVWYSCGFAGPVEVSCKANEINRFSVSPSQMGMGCVASRVDYIDGD